MSDERAMTIHDVIPQDFHGVLEDRDGASKLLKLLPARCNPESVATTALKTGSESAHNIWEQCGCFYKTQERFHEAIAIFEALYEQLLTYQIDSGNRAHKGAPLVWLSECHAALNRPSIARRFLMQTACEDVIHHEGSIDALVNGGFYFRAVWGGGLPHDLLDRYVSRIWNLYQKHPECAMFAEWTIQQLDQEWMATYPTAGETGEWRISPRYMDWLLAKLGDGTGKVMELLAHYLLSAIPGCRAHMRRRTHSTDLDVTGAFEGPVQDFRTDIGRYFVCECKDWGKPADVTAFAKFSRILDSTKCRFGILFSREGISGEGRGENAEREQLKLFQDRGVAIIVVNENDLQEIAAGRNFITMLRTRYETVRLDLRDSGPQIETCV